MEGLWQRVYCEAKQIGGLKVETEEMQVRSANADRENLFVINVV